MVIVPCSSIASTALIMQRHEDLHELLAVRRHVLESFTEQRIDPHLLEARVMLDEEQRVLDDLVDVRARLRDRLRPAEVEQAIDDALAAMHLVVDDLEELVGVARRPDAVGRRSSSRSVRLSAQAAIVASGLLISCMTPAASWPIAASFSAWAKRSCDSRHSVTSSPIAITCVMPASVSRIGIFEMRNVRASPLAVDSMWTV